MHIWVLRVNCHQRDQVFDIMDKQESQATDITLAKFYGDDYYKRHIDSSLRSAFKYADLLSPIFKPQTVVDVGCGRGAWLKAFKDRGAWKLVGYDGAWNTQDKMIDQSIKFYCIDLHEPISLSVAERFDLAMSLEVAEHLKSSSAFNFIQSLTNLSDVVLFGAAYTKQGGKNHINEQPHTYWANIFSKFDYIPYDFFRPVVWGDDEISFWYRQNTFLYVKKSSSFTQVLHSAGHSAMEDISFLDCIHPRLYEKKLSQLETEQLNRRIAIRVIPKTLRRIAKKLKNLLS